jgi:hypothetical protein
VNGELHAAAALPSAKGTAVCADSRADLGVVAKIIISAPAGNRTPGDEIIAVLARCVGLHMIPSGFPFVTCNPICRSTWTLDYRHRKSSVSHSEARTSAKCKNFLFPQANVCEALISETNLESNLLFWSLFIVLSKSFRTGRMERELQMVQLSDTRCSYIAIL